MTVMSPAMTQAGMILGTAAYMSPEQARGRVADRRADIWAFGAVLFEMLTGERLFAGETVTEVLAAVLKDPLRLDRLPPGIPASLRQLISRCLERDPRMRLRDIGEARIALSGVQTGERSAPALERASARHVVLPAAVARRSAALAALALAGLAAYVAWQAKPAASIPVRRFELPAAMAPASIFAISPDGSRIAYVAQGHLFVHTLATAATADLGVVPVPTEGLLWSPDGRRLAYSAESDLRIVPAEGGPPFTVCRIPGGGRLTKGWWHDDGTIYFAVLRESLYRVPASGGTPVRVTAIAPEKEIDFHSVAVLPDGRLIVTTHLRGQDAVRLDLVDGGDRTSARRRSRHRHRQVSRAQRSVVRASAQESRRVGRAVRWRPDRSDAGDAARSRRARLQRVRRRDARVVRAGARASRARVGRRTGRRPSGPGKTHSTRSIATMPGAPFEAGLAVARAVARWPARSVCHPRRRRRRRVPRARSGDGPRHARARAEGLDGRRRPADGSRGRRRAGCCIRPEVSRRCRSTTGPRMDRRAAGRSWPAWPRR